MVTADSSGSTGVPPREGGCKAPGRSGFSAAVSLCFSSQPRDKSSRGRASVEPLAVAALGVCPFSLFCLPMGVAGWVAWRTPGALARGASLVKPCNRVDQPCIHCVPFTAKRSVLIGARQTADHWTPPDRESSAAFRRGGTGRAATCRGGRKGCYSARWTCGTCLAGP